MSAPPTLDPAAALAVACPYCHAEVGAPCRTQMGTIDRSANPHNARITEHWRAQKRGTIPDPAVPSLFDPAPAARASDPATSHAAAHSMHDAAVVQRARILTTLRECGPASADEIDRTLGWRATTAGRRLGELLKLGRVRVVADAHAKTRSGRAAQVYEAVP